MMKNYPGSKSGSGVAEKIISQMPFHTTYVEGFLGSGQIFQKKKLAEKSILIDADPKVIAAWKKHGHFYIDQPKPPSVTLLQGRFEEWVRSFASIPVVQDPLTLLNLDPPYLNITRSHQKLYACELLTVDEHSDLLASIFTLPCMVMISGYWSTLYMTMLQGWRYEKYRTMTRGGPREEYLWMNFPEPTVLHDCRFVGGNYRERERIKRKKRRWADRFSAMSSAERQCIGEALAEIDHKTKTTPAAASGESPPPPTNA